MIGTVTALIAYAGARGTVIADDAATLQALARASDYIQFTYLDGSSCTVDSDNVVEAAYEAAIAEVATPGILDQDIHASRTEGSCRRWRY